jgi:alpha-L-fucosidase
VTSPTDWFTEARLGLWVHWGLGAVAPGELSWYRYYNRVGDVEYRRYFDHFDPDLYDPRTWARAARAAGVGYATLVAKHHDGFCLWDSAYTEFKATNTPARRDLVGPFVDALRAEGIRVGLYYSLLDWHHPEFPLDGFHPLRDDAEAIANNDRRDISKYADYVHAQVRELLSGFGQIDVLWLDFSYRNWELVEREGFPAGRWPNAGKGAAEWRSQELLRLARELQPGILVNDRAGIPGDFITPEYQVPPMWPERDGRRECWEASLTLNETWAYNRDDLQWKPVDLIVRTLIEVVSKGGNLVVNVGPTGRGELDARTVARLAGLGEWMRLHRRAIVGCTASELVPPSGCLYTKRDDRLYVHVFAWPYRHLHLPGLAGKVVYAQLLHDASEIKMRVVESHDEAHPTTLTGVAAGSLTLELPAVQPDAIVPVIELFLA